MRGNLLVRLIFNLLHLLTLIIKLFGILVFIIIIIKNRHIKHVIALVTTQYSNINHLKYLSKIWQKFTLTGRSVPHSIGLQKYNIFCDMF